MPRQLGVVYTPLKSCLINLPPTWVTALLDQGKVPQNITLELTWTPRSSSSPQKAYVGWTGAASSGKSSGSLPNPSAQSRSEDTIEIDPQFAQGLGLADGAKVQIAFPKPIPGIASSIHVEPFSADDWEIMELHAGYLEENLLAQLRVVWVGEIVTVWIHGRTLVRLKVVETSPALPCVRLDTNVEVIVAPKVRRAPAAGASDTKEIHATHTTHSTDESQMPFKVGKSKLYRLQPPESVTSELDGTSDSFKLPYFTLSHPSSHIFASSTSTSVTQRTPGVNIRISRPIPAYELDSNAKDSLSEDGRSGHDAQKVGGPTLPNGEGSAESDEVMKPHVQKQLYMLAFPDERVPEGHLLFVERRKDDLGYVCSPLMQLDLESMDVVLVANVVGTGQTTKALIVRKCVNNNSKDGLGSSNKALRLGAGQNASSKVASETQRRELCQKIKGTLAQGFPLILTHGMRIAVPPQISDPLPDPTEYMITLSNESSGISGAMHSLVGGLTDGLSDGRMSNKVSSSGGISADIDIFSTIPDQDALEKLGVEIGRDVWIADAKRFDADNENGIRKPHILGGVNGVLDKFKEYIGGYLGRSAVTKTLGITSSGGILLTGGHGSGKTAITNAIINHLRADTISLACEISGAEHADDRVPAFREKLLRWFDMATWHSPSILVFDNLDRIIPAEVEHADSFRSRQLAEVFLQCCMQYRKHQQNFLILATSQHQQSIHPLLVTSHLFSELLHIQPPNKQERKEILEALLAGGSDICKRSLSREDERKKPGGLDLVSVASDTEGYSAADLQSLVERSVHEAAVRNIKAIRERQKKSHKSNDESPSIPTGVNGIDHIPTSSITAPVAGSEGMSDFLLTQEDFEKARKGFVPASLRGVKLQTSQVGWADIGGLRETKKTLLETLEWPTKYASIFQSCPLRLRSGLLLYGYPGCGKTLLASAVAKECGLNFISVKGPELLNKYIGASEKSVRDLFERAQAARPCVLFFDEFDSIAPKRGHDSTGVTDRVVNQMLTQMDGAEGLEGVYVLAATSRPDLIDSALLRPGRLDKSLLCGIPDFEDRLEILQSLALKMSLDPSVDLRFYAEKTEGLTGADLQAFFYNAHLEAIHDNINKEQLEKQLQARKNDDDQQATSEFFTFKLDDSTTARKLTLAEKGHISDRLSKIRNSSTRAKNATPNGVTASPSQATADGHVVITAIHLDRSLASTRPSISPEERFRFDMIYHEFVTGRSGEMPSGEGAKGIGKRTTLG
ncbi:hypothetical protein BZG36_03349 [Bifiguratus adelaidae]|uniref:Peroxisomal ATPase PEX1 n=1 Tax=Bifiguratus adelaidae TaxID=1938954 RepID=A0A261XWK7_9FUNG|nr:hypothetical protein BZG36_03349 [Bifiguratus adelaidae]